MQYVPLPLDDKREYHTVAGLLMEYLQHVPQVGRPLRLTAIPCARCRSTAIGCRMQIVPPVKQDELDYEVSS